MGFIRAIGGSEKEAVMGEAYDRTGAFLGSAEAATKQDVLKKLMDAHGDKAHEIRIRTLEEPSGASAEMPRYRCHKEVWALKISAITFDASKAAMEGRETDGSATIVPAEDGYGPFKVDSGYLRKHSPQPGGYYVVYKDGYKSFSPADAFEEGYARL
jgi:hypothetical protein